MVDRHDDDLRGCDDIGDVRPSFETDDADVQTQNVPRSRTQEKEAEGLAEVPKPLSVFESDAGAGVLGDPVEQFVQISLRSFGEDDVQAQDSRALRAS